MVPYAMTKGAELALTRSLSANLMKKGGLGGGVGWVEGVQGLVCIQKNLATVAR